MTTDSPPIQRPNPLLAGLLALLGTPLAMLYVKRAGWALAYLAIALVLSASLVICSFLEIGTAIPAIAYVVPGLLLKLACAVHAFVLARRATPAERPWYSRWYGLASSTFALILAAFLLRSFVFEPFRAANLSMHPTIPRGVMLMVDKLGIGNYGAYGLSFPESAHNRRIARADVVAYRRPDDPQLIVVHRVIGLPGDHIQYLNRQLTINDVPVIAAPGEPDDSRDGLNYRYATEVIDGRRFDIAWILERQFRGIDIIVPPGHFMMLGDNRDNAKDSRYVGTVPHSNILGIVSNFQPAALAR